MRFFVMFALLTVSSGVYAPESLEKSQSDIAAEETLRLLEAQEQPQQPSDVAPAKAPQQVVQSVVEEVPKETDQRITAVSRSDSQVRVEKEDVFFTVAMERPPDDICIGGAPVQQQGIQDAQSVFQVELGSGNADDDVEAFVQEECQSLLHGNVEADPFVEALVGNFSRRLREARAQRNFPSRELSRSGLSQSSSDQNNFDKGERCAADRLHVQVTDRHDSGRGAEAVVFEADWDNRLAPLAFNSGEHLDSGLG